MVTRLKGCFGIERRLREFCSYVCGGALPFWARLRRDRLLLSSPHVAPISSVREGELLRICRDRDGGGLRVSSTCCSHAACDPQVPSWPLYTRAAEGGAGTGTACPESPPDPYFLDFYVCFLFCPSPVALLCRQESVSVPGRLCASWGPGLALR